MWRQWTNPNQKPPVDARIDSNHPIGGPLIAAWLFNEGTGRRVTDHSANLNHAYLNGDIPGNWKPSDHGISLDTSTYYGAIFHTPMFNFPTDDFSMYIYFSRTTDNETSPGLIDKVRGDRGSPSWSIHISDPVNKLRWQPSIDGANWVFDSGTITYPGTHFGCLTRRSGSFFWHVRGDSPSDTSVAKSGTIASNSNAVLLGIRNDGGLLNGIIHYAGILRQGLTQTEVDSLHADPYQMFEVPVFSISTFVPMMTVARAPSLIMPTQSGAVTPSHVVTPKQKPSAEVQRDGEFGPGLLGVWTFSENSGTLVRDRSGNDNHGRMRENYMDPATDWVAGPHGSAVDFNGTNQCIVVPAVGNNHPLDVRGDEITIFAIVRPHVYPGTNGTIATKRDAYYFALSAMGYPLFYSYGTTPAGYTAATTKPPIDEWSTLSVTYDGRQLRFVVNGVEAGTSSRTGNLTPNSTAYNFEFAGEVTEGRWLNCQIAMVALWDVGMTLEQQQRLHENPYSMFQPQVDRSFVSALDEQFGWAGFTHSASSGDWVVSGAGTSAYDGDYFENGTYNGQPSYRLDDTHWLFWWTEGDLTNKWALGPSVGTDPAYIGSVEDPLPAAPWSTFGGSPPAPTLSAGEGSQLLVYVDGQVREGIGVDTQAYMKYVTVDRMLGVYDSSDTRVAAYSDDGASTAGMEIVYEEGAAELVIRDRDGNRIKVWQ